MSDLQKLAVGDLLEDKREAILQLMGEFGAENVRVFGSTARGEAGETSDIDFLVDFVPGYTIWKHIGLAQALEDLLGCKVDVAVEAALDERLRPNIMRDAVIRNFEVIGEVVKRLPDEWTGAYPHIAWNQIAGFCDFLIHHYNRVDPLEVWKIVENDLQPLKQAIESMLQSDTKADES